MRIYKYAVPVGNFTTVHLPLGFRILHVGLQDRLPYMWAIVDPDAKTEPVTFRWVATGQDFEPEGKYVGTIHPVPYVFHLFRL